MDTGALAKHSTFGRRMDVLFGATARNADGRMTQIRRGPSGIKLLLQYLRKINRQTDGILLTVATLKLTQLLEEIQCLWCSKSGHRSIQRSSINGFGITYGVQTKRLEKHVTVEDSNESEDDGEEDEPSPAARTSHKSKRDTIVVSSDSESDFSLDEAPKDRDETRACNKKWQFLFTFFTYNWNLCYCYLRNFGGNFHEQRLPFEMFPQHHCPHWEWHNKKHVPVPDRLHTHREYIIRQPRIRLPIR
ncbi:hypothetical protein B0H13DRAFT_2358091 [Mycena leptocephala]|nr:hypothetical protein B0H13DRAFT_2358091 [Mycena leptocephala]